MIITAAILVLTGTSGAVTGTALALLTSNHPDPDQPADQLPADRDWAADQWWADL